MAMPTPIKASTGGKDHKGILNGRASPGWTGEKLAAEWSGALWGKLFWEQIL